LSTKPKPIETSSQVTLSLGDGKPLVVSRNGGNLTPLGGLPLLGKVERLVRLIEGSCERLKDHRTQSLIDHELFDAIKARVFSIAAGMPAAEDADSIRKDAALKKACLQDPETGQDAPSQSTYCRIENAVDEKDLAALHNWLVDYYIRCRRKPPRRIVLYCDGSAVQTYGNQQCAIYRGGKYKKEMYFPLFIFDSTGWLLVSELREGDQGEVKRGKTALIAVIKRLKKIWPQVRIGVRADAGFNSPWLYKWLEKLNVDYAIGIPGNHAIASLAYDYLCEARKKFKRKFGEPVFIGSDGKKKKQKIHAKIRRMTKAQKKDALADWQQRRVRIYGEVSYRARTWNADRRIICRCDYTDSGVECRYVVTNIVLACPQTIYETEYCPHANVERSIKEFKNGLLLRLSCEKFTANAFRLILHGLAYQLLYHLKQFLPSKLQCLSLESVRKMFINIAAKVTCSERRVYWALSDTYTHAVDFLRLCRKLARAG
jgi:Transposase DDE domain group 1